MSFIAKNPLTIPEVDNSPSVPQPGTRALFAGKGGWYDIDSSGNTQKLTTGADIGDLSSLTTTDKTSIINAINEVQTEVGQACLDRERLQYYGDANIVPSSMNYFNFYPETGTIRLRYKEDITETEIVVPYMVDGVFVTSIDYDYTIDEFITVSGSEYTATITSTNDTIEKIILPNTITSIGRYAFAKLTKLTDIVIPNKVTEIEEFAFYYTSSLMDIKLPNSVTSLASGSFAGSSLVNVFIPDTITTFGESVFGDKGSCYVTIICNQGSKAEAYAKEYEIRYMYAVMSKGIFTMSIITDDDVITSDKTYAEVKEAYDNGLAIYLNLNGALLFPVVTINDSDLIYFEVCSGDYFRVYEFNSSNELYEIVNLAHLSDETYYQEVGDVANLPTKSNIVDEINTQHEEINELRNEMSGLDVNITVHSSDEEMHITYDERKFWNTVSDKAKQSDVGDISQLPTGSENVVAEMNELYTMIDNNQADITSLQTQMGDVETALADIRADQEALINGGEE